MHNGNYFVRDKKKLNILDKICPSKRTEPLPDFRIKKRTFLNEYAINFLGRV